jgi:hypothetical protein
VLVTVEAAPNQQPVADAGQDQTVTGFAGENITSVTLDGRNSSDSDGEITQYLWYENGELIATGIMPEVVLPIGIHTISLTVIDSGAPLLSDSDDVVITLVGQQDTTPPHVEITSLADGSIVIRKSVITVNAMATDESGTVTGVELYVNDDLKGKDLTAPYTFSWKVPAAKNKKYRLSARAYDAAGNIGLATEVIVHAK